MLGRLLALLSTIAFALSRSYWLPVVAIVIALSLPRAIPRYGGSNKSNSIGSMRVLVPLKLAQGSHVSIVRESMKSLQILQWGYKGARHDKHWTLVGPGY